MLPEIISVPASKAIRNFGLFFFQNESEGAKESQFLFVGKRNKDLEKLTADLKTGKFFNGGKSESHFLRFYEYNGAKNLFLFGAGKKESFSFESARKLGSLVFREQKKEKLDTLTLDFESLFSVFGAKDLPYAVQAFCEGYLLTSYEYLDLKTEKKRESPVKTLEFYDLKNKALTDSITLATTLAKHIFFARELGDRPANYLTPAMFADLVSERSKKVGLKCTVLNEKQIEKEKMGLFLGVSRGSIEEPKFLVLEHAGKGKGQKPVVLVGKGITFDTGGISLKPPAKMEEMKYDMMGAATVAGIMLLVAELKLSVPVIGLIAACENMPGGKAQKPGDVAVGRSGTTVEIINTDAEGRLILADALDYGKDFKPQAMIDFATLTGAVVVALGSVTTGIMGTGKELIQKIKDSSEHTGEKVWELPLYEEYDDDIKSNYADLKNVGTGGEAGSSKGGAFLKAFVPKDIPWVHCDIAGSAWNRKDIPYAPSKYASGVMIRLMVDMLSRWKS